MLDPLYYSNRPYLGAFLAQRSLRIVTPPAGEQVTLTQARTHLRLDTYGSPASHPDDEWLETIGIPAARELCELISGRALAPTVFEVGLGGFPAYCFPYDRREIDLKVGPVVSVASVEYTDTSGATVALVDGTDYVVDRYSEPGFVYPAYGVGWPATRETPNAVRIRFTAGYDLASASPQDLPLPASYRMAILLALGHFYENREETTTLSLDHIPAGINALLRPESLRRGFA